MYTLKQVAFETIQTAKNSEQFRDNLKKYFFTVKENLMVRHQNYKSGFVNINSIETMDDVYKITKSGWFGNGQSFELTPLCNITKEGIDYISNFAKGSHLVTRIIEVLNDPKRSTILEVSSNDNLMSDLETKNFAPGWVKMDNQIWRTFFGKTLGEYSGYENDEDDLSFYNKVGETKELEVLS
jgi:hypothetical protein